MAKKEYVTMKPKRKGQRVIKFEKGGLHRSTGTPMGQPIPKSKIAKAAAGGYGPKAKRQVQFAKNVLKMGKKKR